MEETQLSESLSDHLYEYRSVEKKRLLLSFTITSIVMFLELIGGIFTNSLALISDAGHMFTHSFAIAISLFAMIIAGKLPPCHHRTFGLYRAEILAAFINGLFLLLIVGTLIYEAILRILFPTDVLAVEMFLIALIGLAVNISSIFILQGSNKKDLNIRGLFYHILGDTVSSIGIVLAAITIFYTGWTFIDPLVSLLISAIILIWALGILKDSTRILLEMTPPGLNIDIIKDDLKSRFPEINEVSNAHLWTITSDMLVFSAHLKLKNPKMSDLDQEELIDRINEALSQKYHIIESTIQLCR
ncbi:MAG: cation transporter [Candidatus Heimdallarchaeota archaeon]|nr:MAG: cation transporter [Candidatus Heimdallarchaeota archaeon]